MSPIGNDCPHLESVGEITKEELIQKSHNGCAYVGCGESHADHSTVHSQDTRHNLTVNLTTLRVWCYACGKEVFLERKLGPCCPASSTKPHTPIQNHVQVQPLVENCLVFHNVLRHADATNPPLTQFFVDCGGLVRTDKKPALCKSYQKLVSDIWHKNRPGYVVPTNLFQGIKAVNPMFRGYSQQDSQEFLRCLMDQLHEELKEGQLELDEGPPAISMDENMEEDKSQSDNDFQSCESCGSSDKAESETNVKLLTEGAVEAEMLISDEVKNHVNNKDWQKEKNLINKLYRASSSEDLDKDIDTAAEATPIISNQGTVKVQIQSRLSDCFPDVHVNSSSRPHSPLPSEGIHPKLSSSPPKSTSVWPSSHKKVAPFSSPKKTTQKKYRSVISDVFDGTIVSSVQCLTCDRVSVILETFQDISLPIPGKEDLAKLHSSTHQTSLAKAGSCGEAYAPQGWVSFVMEYIKSWFWGPVVTLQDCLAAFFARDELKGDNMYSCEKCKKLRNGVKFCKVQSLPEILCIHLKRFRHELMFSTKIGTHVSFPLEGLDLQPFLAKDCAAQTTSYDLLSVICHHGTASSGHYIAYCRNDLNSQWYEFDDQSVTEVSESSVQNAEAYVLFYKKSNEEAQKERRKVSSLLNMMEPSLLQFYISRQWLNKFKTFAEPGPISNNDFLCAHGGGHYIAYCRNDLNSQWYEFDDQSVTEVSESSVQNAEAYVLFYKYNCKTIHTSQYALHSYDDRMVRICLSLAVLEPPGPVDNTKIAMNKSGHITLKQGADSGQISEETWNFLHSIYGGGPEVTLRPNIAHQESETSQAEEKIEMETRAV
ncbi:UNVERIFIED_CONTAM: hypothetical protein FKN15_059548 [Acipenser sinensis]